MSNRTMIELNHDYCPSNDDAALLAWAKGMWGYMRCGDPNLLPNGVTWFGMRHHIEPCPLPLPKEGV